MSEIAKYFLSISWIMILVDVIFSVKSLRKKTRLGESLGMLCAMCATSTAFYSFSVTIADYRLSSIFSSLQFISIDFLVIYFLRYAAELTGFPTETDAVKRIRYAIRAYLAFDVLVLCINPFYEIAIHYVTRPGVSIAYYQYDMKMLYSMHLAFTYLLIVLSVWMTYRKMSRVPKEYRSQYRMTVLGVLIVVLINAAYLFVEDKNQIDNLDFSVWAYTITAAFFYLGVFRFSRRAMLNILRAQVIDNVSQGIVMFDYEDKLVLWNERAEKMIPNIKLEEGLQLQKLIDTCRIPLAPKKMPVDTSFQFYSEKDGKTHPLRCDYHPQRNKLKQNVSRLLVLTDAALESDLLTGYHSWDSFQQLANEFPESYSYSAIVVVADISGLTDINNSLGYQAGDRMMTELAELFRANFPQDTYFVRGTEGKLIVIKRGQNEGKTRESVQKVAEAFHGYFVYAIAPTSSQSNNIMAAIEEATKALQTKKLMDRHSRHSEVLNSLIRALEECDTDTEAHVQRTQEMGNELGIRLGLNDVDRSDLSLLCILHDIGKIGVPLEILNKPGKLNEAEWRTVQTHVSKGAQIARSTEGFSGIADMILHHHERWDGNGYPDGLSKESIPLLSRVIAVVDSYDAMVSDRAYRRGMSKDAAIEELRRCAGTQFDPAITAEFIQMLRETDFGNHDTAKDHDNQQAAVPQEKREEEAKNTRVHAVKYARYVLDTEMRVIEINGAFEEITGYTREDVASGELTQTKLIPKEDQTEYITLTTALLANSDLAYCEHRLLRKDGTITYVFCNGRSYYSSADREQRSEILIMDAAETTFVRTIRDNEEKNELKRQARWEDKFRKDSLTGLLTHEALRSDTDERLLGSGCRALMIMMDLDHFKQYNDSYGHMAGDDYLKLAGAAIRSAIRETDLASRMGGDEFATVMFFDADTPDEVIHERTVQVYEMITKKLKDADHGSGVSMGAVLSSEKCDTFNEMYAAADQALYESKEGGRGRLSFFEEIRSNG